MPTPCWFFLNLIWRNPFFDCKPLNIEIILEDLFKNVYKKQFSIFFFYYSEYIFRDATKVTINLTFFILENKERSLPFKKEKF